MEEYSHRFLPAFVNLHYALYIMFYTTLCFVNLNLFYIVNYTMFYIVTLYNYIIYRYTHICNVLQYF